MNLTNMTRYGFISLLLLVLVSCVPSIQLHDVATLRMGMGPDESVAAMGTPPRHVFEWSLPETGDPIVVQSYLLRSGGYDSTYLLAYRNESLIFWGYPHEFARSSDPILNQIGKEAVLRQSKLD